MTDIAANEGAGFINYMWQQQLTPENSTPKLSYVKLFPQWQWIVGTGLYLDDTKKEISALTAKLSTFALSLCYYCQFFRFTLPGKVS